MGAVVSDTRLGQMSDTDDVFGRADRLWWHAEQLYALADGPYVSRETVKAAPSIWDILVRVCEAAYEAGRRDAEKENAREIRRLNASIARLEAEIRALGGDPQSLQTRRSHMARSAPERPAGDRSQGNDLIAALNQSPLMRDFGDAVAARATIDGMSFVFYDREIPQPPAVWPECIRRPVASVTIEGLFVTTRDVITGRMQPWSSESRDDYLARFTRRILRLDPALRGAAAHAIFEGRWQRAANPVAYIKTVAQRQHYHAEGWLDPARSSDAFALGVPLSLDMPMTSDPLGALIAAPTDPLEEVEVLADLERAISQAGLTVGTRLALAARLQDISRREAPRVLGLSVAEAERTWKALQRALPELRKHLSA